MNIGKFFKVLVSILLIFAVVLGGTYIARVWSNPFKEDITAGDMDPLEKTDNKVKVNILLLGLDKGQSRTDVIMLCCYDQTRNKFNLISIPRDTKVTYDKHTELINAAYGMPVYNKNGTSTKGGVALTIDKVKGLMNIPINYYAVFTFDAFKKTIDAMGGVDFDVPQNMHYSDPYQDLFINLKKGQQTLDGSQAEQLVRFRRYVRGDLDRVSVQQDLFKALAKQYLNVSSVKKIPKIYSILKNDVTTDMDSKTIAYLTKRMLDLNVQNDISTYTLPTYSDGGSHLYPDRQGIQELMTTTLNY
ncbi:MAG: LCP family protein [Bacillota bacterium]|nr:LCP family protein [Bacillota bacterium]